MLSTALSGLPTLGSDCSAQAIAHGAKSAGCQERYAALCTYSTVQPTSDAVRHRLLIMASPFGYFIDLLPSHAGPVRCFFIVFQWILLFRRLPRMLFDPLFMAHVFQLTELSFVSELLLRSPDNTAVYHECFC